MPLHVAILTPPAHGHVNPFLPIAAELVRRGDRVTFALHDPFRGQVEATGAGFVSLGETGSPPGPLAAVPDDEAERRAVSAAFFARFRAGTWRGLRELLTLGPDLLLYDAMYQALGVAEVREAPLPRVALCPSFAFPDGMTARTMFDWMAKAAGADGNLAAVAPSGFAAIMANADLPFRAEPLTLVTIPRSWQPHAEQYDARYRFVGPSLREEAATDFPLPVADGRPRVLVSLGTVASDKPDFYRAVFAAVAGRDWQVVVSTGRTDPALLGPVPANVVAAPHVPQVRVLRQTDVFVTHGGMNSTMEALALGVPLVVAPQMADQYLNAQRVRDLGLGRSLAGQEATPEALVAAIEATLADDAARQRVAAIRAEMADAGGAVAAVDAIHAVATPPVPVPAERA